MRLASLPAAFLAALFIPSTGAWPQNASSLKELPVDSSSVTIINAPKNAKISEMDGGGIRITYENSDFHPPSDRISIVKTFNPPIVMVRETFELSAPSGKVWSMCGFPGGSQSIETSTESQGPGLAEYSFDFVAVASGRSLEMKPVSRLVIRVNNPPESGEQVIELKNWRVE